MTKQQQASEVKLTYSLEEAAVAIGVCTRTVSTLVGNGRLRVCRVGRRVLVPIDAIEEFLAGRGTNQDTAT